MLTYLDTHTALWLANGSDDELSALALQLIAGEELRVSPIILLETSLLREINRLKIGAGELRTILVRDFEVVVCGIPFQQVVEAAYAETWTRDPFDRLIVAQARVAGAKLLTKDRRIHAHFDGAIW